MLTFHLFFITITISKREKEIDYKKIEQEIYLEKVFQEIEAFRDQNTHMRMF